MSNLAVLFIMSSMPRKPPSFFCSFFTEGSYVTPAHLASYSSFLLPSRSLVASFHPFFSILLILCVARCLVSHTVWQPPTTHTCASIHTWVPVTSSRNLPQSKWLINIYWMTEESVAEFLHSQYRKCFQGTEQHQRVTGPVQIQLCPCTSSSPSVLLTPAGRCCCLELSADTWLDQWHM